MLKLFIKTVVSLIAVVAVNTAAQAQTYDYFLLAAQWEPGFCATSSGNSECTNLKGSYAASNFSLHGLWPNDYTGTQPFYCGVSQKEINLDKSSTWCQMDAYGVTATGFKKLTPYMPGVAECLDKHEYYKHGSCSGMATPDAFWGAAEQLVQGLNSTSFNSFIQTHLGQYVTRAQMLTAFDNAFGSNTHTAVSLKCVTSGGKNYFTEAWISINKDQLAQFPSGSSLVLDGNVASTCPKSNIYIVKP